MSTSYGISKSKRSYEPILTKKRYSSPMKHRRYNRFVNEHHNLVKYVSNKRHQTSSQRKKYSTCRKSYSDKKDIFPVDATRCNVRPQKCCIIDSCYDYEDYERIYRNHRDLDYEDNEVIPDVQEVEVEEVRYENCQLFPDESPRVGFRNIMNYCLDRNTQYTISRIQSDFKLTEKYKEFVLYEMPHLEVFKPMPSMTMKMNDRFKCLFKQILDDEEQFTDRNYSIENENYAEMFQL